MAVELNSDRIKSPIYERAWQELALRIPIQIPKQWKMDESTGSNSQSIQNS